MKLSIIIPTHNQSETLAESIESALAQTVPCEIIVVNDGSTDLTKQVLYEYEDKVKVITQSNRGLPGARNTGIMNATGDWILPLDSDDTLNPNCVERLIQVIEECLDADVVSPSFTTFGLSNELVLLQMRPTLDDFKQGNRLGYCSAIKKSVLLEVGGYNAKMVWGYEDYALWINLARLGKKFYTIPESLWNYRVKADSMIQTANKHAVELRYQIEQDNLGFKFN